MTPHDLFDAMADAFNQRDFERMAGCFAERVTLAIGGKGLAAETAGGVAAIFRTYRQNLDVEAFARTACTVVYVAPEEAGRQQVLARWVNTNDQGAEISSFDSNFILERGVGDRLICVTAEIVDPVQPRLTQGLPLA